jgi:UDP-glucose 4-epimerase
MLVFFEHSLEWLYNMGSEMTRTLVTGGAGFVGSFLSEELIEQGHEVIVIDDLSTGALENLDAIKGHKNFRFVEGTVLDEKVMSELIGEADNIYHLAAAVGVKLIVDQPVQTIETNISATEIVLKLVAEDNKPMLITSTSEVYGKLQKEKFNEDDDLVMGPTSRARWAYAASKIIDEFLALAYYQEQGTPVKVVRLFNVIGPRQKGRYGMVVPRFVKQALTGEAITVYGDGTQRRSFTWVGDVVPALIKLMYSAKAEGQIVNIGHKEDISIFELAELVKKKVNSDSVLELVPFEKAYSANFEDMQRRMPDISKVQKMIGYDPKIELGEMLDLIIASQRKAAE